MAKEMAKKEENALATSSMFAEDAGQGMEGATAESFAIPFLTVLQKGSPQVDEASGVAIEGARAGMLFENISGTLTPGKTGLVVVPCAYRRVFLHWAVAGFRGELLPETVADMRARGEVVEHKGKLYIPNSAGVVDPDTCDKIADTRNHYVLILDNGVWKEALMSLSSTQIKKSKMLMSALASVKVQSEKGTFTPPTFANLVRVTTVPESNDKGSWFGYKFELDGTVADPDLYLAAKAFHASIAQGEVKVKYAETEKEGF